MKTYLLAPLLALAIFGACYWQFAREQTQQRATLAAQAATARTVALAQETADRDRALQEALATQAQRKKDLAEKSARTLADQEARQSALIARDQARDDQTRLTRDADRLRRDLADEQTALAALQREQTSALNEQAFLKQFATQSAANLHDLEAVLKKLSPPLAPTPTTSHPAP